MADALHRQILRAAKRAARRLRASEPVLDDLRTIAVARTELPARAIAILVDRVVVAYAAGASIGLRDDDGDLAHVDLAIALDELVEALEQRREDVA